MMARLMAAVTGAAGAALVLRWAAPGPAEVLVAVRSPAEFVGWHGADQAVLIVAAAIGWLVLAWLVLGLVVVAAGELPGAVGTLARALGTFVVPAAVRQTLTLALGVGIVAAGAGVATAAPAPQPPAGVAPGAALDWPRQSPVVPAPPPVDPPAYGPPSFADPTDGVITVDSGDSLWAIATDQLPPGASASSIAITVEHWYAANRNVIGPDPDLIRPGQQLTPPEAGS